MEIEIYLLENSQLITPQKRVYPGAAAAVATAATATGALLRRPNVEVDIVIKAVVLTTGEETTRPHIWGRARVREWGEAAHKGTGSIDRRGARDAHPETGAIAGKFGPLP